MRSIFFLLFFVNAALLAWRVAGELPNHYRAPVRDSAEQLRIQGPQIRLLGESPLAGEGVQSLPAQCKMAGPFASPEVAGAFRQRLAALDVTAAVSSLRRSSGEGFWVHFPAEQSIAAAKQRLANLHKRGIDSYIITEGELKNSISVGLFSERASANARVAELEALGYDTVVHAIDRFQEEVWVVLGEGEGQKIAASAWKTLVHDDFSVRSQEKPCLDVASR